MKNRGIDMGRENGGRGKMSGTGWHIIYVGQNWKKKKKKIASKATNSSTSNKVKKETPKTKPWKAPGWIKVGACVRHVGYGEGRITSIDTKQNRVCVRFGSEDEDRVLGLSFVVNNKLLFPDG